MKKKTAISAQDEDILIDLTLHDVPVALISEFTEKIVKPYYHSNLNATIQDLISKTLSEQDYINSHITHLKLN